MSLPVNLKSDGHEGASGGGHPEVIDEVILATAGYDHTIKFWQAHTGKCVRTLQHADSQVNALEISPDGQILAAAGYQVRLTFLLCNFVFNLNQNKQVAL